MRCCIHFYLLYLLLFSLLVTGCDKEPEVALGTLERDRVNIPATAFEEIVDIFVEEGGQVTEGEPLLTLDDRKIVLQIREKEARLEQARWKLQELLSGPRAQTIAEAKARLKAAGASLANSREIYRRQQQLFKTDISSREHLDGARSAYINAREKVNEYTERLDELTAGTRDEQLHQAEAEVEALAAALDYLKLVREDYTVRAPRSGVVESLPRERGARVQAGAFVCTLLVGDGPWARMYIPEPYKAAMVAGKEYRLAVSGLAGEYPVVLRRISSEASFSPYYALTERDGSRLTYVAEFDSVDGSLRDLSAGTPVRLILEQP